MLRQPDTGADIPLTNHCKPNELSGTKSFMNYDKNTFFLILQAFCTWNYAIMKQYIKPSRHHLHNLKYTDISFVNTTTQSLSACTF